MENDQPLSSRWRKAVILVMAGGFSLLIMMTVLTYRQASPIPAKVVDENGAVLFTKADILDGQGVFLKYGLMEHGTLWGHGAYLGPDYSAEYIHREAEITLNTMTGERFGKNYQDLDKENQSFLQAELPNILKKNRYDPATQTLAFTKGEAKSFLVQLQEWSDYFTRRNAAPGLPEKYIKNPEELRVLTAYFAWASWSARANRPGRDYSYTSNWPYEPLIGNRPSTEAYVYSALSLITLLGGLGLVLFMFGKFDFLGWRGEGPVPDSHCAPMSNISLTPSQRVTALFFLVVAVLFLLQTLVGGVLAHYRVEPGAFYGFEIAKLIPYNLLRTWHLQLAVFWIATAWVAGGLFLAPLVGGREPKGQRTGAIVLLAVLAVVVFGSLGGEKLGLSDRLGRLWFWFGHQGSEYLDLGRFWQVLLAAGLVFWLLLMFRALRPALKLKGQSELAVLFLGASTAIPFFYLPAFFFGPQTHFAVIDNWRFWIIHLWVEGFFELFATVMVAVMFHRMGLVTKRTATRLVYLDAILYLGGGIVGTAHHWYFTGQESITLALGALFSAMEVVPLTLLTLDAWDFIRLQHTPCGECQKPLAAGQKWAIYFLMAVGVWNFVGAGVFGFLINLPIVSYFEIGTTLTPNHGHAAMFGVFGMLALAVLVFCLRSMQTEEGWGRIEKYFKFSFWGLNAGLALMVVLNLFPAGVLQLWDVIHNGYWHARRLEFTMAGAFHTSEWIRIAGDLTFLIAGVIPLVIGTVLAVVRRERKSA